MATITWVCNCGNESEHPFNHRFESVPLEECLRALQRKYAEGHTGVVCDKEDCGEKLYPYSISP